MDAELRFHIEAYAEDLIRSRAPRSEAMRRARIEFGGIEQCRCRRNSWNRRSFAHRFWRRPARRARIDHGRDLSTGDARLCVGMRRSFHSRSSRNSYCVSLAGAGLEPVSGKLESGSIPSQYSVLVWRGNLCQLRARTPRLACGSNGRAAARIASPLFPDLSLLFIPLPAESAKQPLLAALIPGHSSRLIRQRSYGAAREAGTPHVAPFRP
jgi:hypothetical protein